MPNLRSKDRTTESSEPHAPPSPSSCEDSSGYLARIDTVVQKAVAMAMERERQKLNDDMLRRENKMRDILDEKLASLHDLEVSIDSKLKQLRDLEKSCSDNTSKVNDLTNRLDHLEQYSRRNNIRILGVPMKPNEDTDAIVCDVAQQIGVTINTSDIDRSHRLMPKPGGAPGNSQGSYANVSRNGKPVHPPIIVKFTSYKPRSRMIKERRLLKGKGIIIVEDLTKKNSNLLQQTSRKANVKASWTVDGRVFALVKSTDGQDRKKLITSLSDLTSI